MLRVGIFAPYCRNETTLAATQFADWLVRAGIDVSFLVDGAVGSGIHPSWDHQVVRYKDPPCAYRWAYGATHLCWFVSNVSVFRQAKVVASASRRQYTQQLFFPSWQNWSDQCQDFLEIVDRVICLSRDMFIWLKTEVPVNFLQGERTWGNLISPDNLLIPRHGRICKDEIRLLSVLPRTVPQDIGPVILDVFDFLLSTHDNLHLSLLLESSWPRRYRKQVVRMSKVHKERLHVIQSPAYYTYAGHVRSHDWVYVCNTRHRYGSLLSTIISSGVPVVAHDVPPIGGHVQDRINGRLIACELGNESYPVAKVRPDDIADTLDSVLSEDSLHLKALQLQSRVVIDRRQKAFEQMIEKEFMA